MSKLQLTHGSLFAGIGGFDLGFERAGFKTVWQVEIDPFCRSVLRKHFPKVKRFEDVKKVGRHNLQDVDCITGGFPCQDVSVANYDGAGLDGARSGLWFEYERIIRELRPRIVVVENVPNLFNRGFSTVLGCLAYLGYDCEWQCIPAVAIGAPHLRWRLFIVAYASGSGWRSIFQSESQSGRGLASHVGRDGKVRPLANADFSRLERWHGRVLQERAGELVARASGTYLADADRPRKPQSRRSKQDERRWSGDGSAALANPDAIRRNTQRVQKSREANEERTRQTTSRPGWWESEPDVGRVAHGIPSRVDRLKGLGNAVVPQIAQWIAERIKAQIEKQAGSPKKRISKGKSK